MQNSSRLPGWRPLDLCAGNVRAVQRFDSHLGNKFYKTSNAHIRNFPSYNLSASEMLNLYMRIQAVICELLDQQHMQKVSIIDEIFMQLFFRSSSESARIGTCWSDGKQTFYFRLFPGTICSPQVVESQSFDAPHSSHSSCCLERTMQPLLSAALNVKDRTVSFRLSAPGLWSKTYRTCCRAEMSLFRRPGLHRFRDSLTNYIMAGRNKGLIRF